MEPYLHNFAESVRKTCPAMTSEELELFMSKLRFKTLQKKEFFLKAGEVQKSMGFITDGLVRSFFVDTEGDERTVGFYAEGEFATHYAAFIAQQPSRYHIQCLETTMMGYLTFEDMRWIYTQSQNFERYGRVVTEEILIRQQARIESFVFQTAEERYLDFIRVYPKIFNRVSLSHLCSYLGIERQTLTRIRQKIAHK